MVDAIGMIQCALMHTHPLFRLFRLVWYGMVWYDSGWVGKTRTGTSRIDDWCVEYSIQYSIRSLYLFVRIDTSIVRRLDCRAETWRHEENAGDCCEDEPGHAEAEWSGESRGGEGWVRAICRGEGEARADRAVFEFVTRVCVLPWSSLIPPLPYTNEHG